MSREAFEKAYHKETGLYASWAPNNKGYTDVIAGMCYRIWQAAQARAVNQQLLESPVDLLKAARGGIKLDAPELSIGYIDAAIDAIAEAQEQSK